MRPFGRWDTTSRRRTPATSSGAAGRSGSPSPRPTWWPSGATGREDWWALAWLRGTELATDVVWSRSASFSRPGARAGMWFAGAANLAMAAGFGRLARERASRRRGLLGRRR